MDNRNLKKTEQQDRKQEKKDGGDIKRMDKPIKRKFEPESIDDKVRTVADLKKTEKPTRKTDGLNTSDGKILADRGDLKKADKQAKKIVDLDTNVCKIPPDRGDLKKAEKQTKKVVETHADRGDLKKVDKVTKKTIDLNTNHPKVHPDNENSDPKIIKVDKPKLTLIIKESDDKTKNINQLNSKEKINKLDVDSAKTFSEDRRKVRERFNLKAKNPPVANVNKDLSKLGNLKAEIKNERTPRKVNDMKDKSDDSNESKQSLTMLNSIKPEKKDVQRKPIIRTISAKNDQTKIFKAVSFIDQKRNKPTLQIKIPHEMRNPNNKSTETISAKNIQDTLSGDNVKEKVNKKTNKKKRHRNDLSPNVSVKIRSPPTEVAKWAPSSINKHTKPYYEAWVSTTLAAISQKSEKDKLFLEKQNILQSFQRALAERPASPELVHVNYTDERYTGRIRIKQR